MIKKVLCFIVLISVLFTTAVANQDISSLVSHYNKVTEDYVPENKAPEEIFFADLIGYEWAEESVYILAKQNIISGKSKGVFAPNDNIKIKEFIKLLVLCAGIYDDDAQCDDYSDVSKDDWSYKYIACAKNANLLGCFDEKLLKSDDYITREQAAFMCAKALEFYSFELSDKTDVLFTDDLDIAQQNKAYIYKLKNANIISGMGDGSFAPKDNLRRCEVAVMILKFRNTIIENL